MDSVSNGNACPSKTPRRLTHTGNFPIITNGLADFLYEGEDCYYLSGSGLFDTGLSGNQGYPTVAVGLQWFSYLCYTCIFLRLIQNPDNPIYFSQ